MTLNSLIMAIVPVQHSGHKSIPLFRLPHKTVCLDQADIYYNVCLGLPDFTTAKFDFISTFETEHPHSNYRNTALDITCDSTHNVAYLIMDFDTERGYDFVTLTDLVGNTQVLREF